MFGPHLCQIPTKIQWTRVNRIEFGSWTPFCFSPVPDFLVPLVAQSTVFFHLRHIVWFLFQQTPTAMKSDRWELGAIHTRSTINSNLYFAFTVARSQLWSSILDHQFIRSFKSSQDCQIDTAQSLYWKNNTWVNQASSCFEGGRPLGF